jgi:hypothetical protein
MIFGNFIGPKKTLAQEENEISVNYSPQNFSSIANKSSYFSRRESKQMRETKMQRAASLMQDANNEELEPRYRYRPEYADTKYVIFPDDNFKVMWDILIIL